MKGNFQIIILVVFIVAAVFGVMVFSGAIKIGSDKNADGAMGTVVLWGTVKTQLISKAIEEFNRDNPTVILKYVQKSSDTFDQDLLEALASGAGPDIFFMSDNLAFHYKNKIYPVPYQTYPMASFKNAFTSAGEVFLTANGILAFPMVIDPMMMYYNRAMLDSNSIVYPPAYWDDFQNIVPLLTKKDESGKIIKSTVAMGQFFNINNAKDIISTIFMQMGNPIILEKSGVFASALGGNNGSSFADLGPALSFYTDFTNPLKNVYSWNRSFPNSQDVFSANNSAFYFGYASELKTILNKNPNLNFSIAPMPQIKNASFKLTSARVLGIAVLISSKNLNAAFSVASLLATTDFAPKFSNALSIPPARRDLLATNPTDAYFPTFFSSALFARSWLDPSSQDTDTIFNGMINKVLSNDMSAGDSIDDAGAKLNLLLTKYR